MGVFVLDAHVLAGRSQTAVVKWNCSPGQSWSLHVCQLKQICSHIDFLYWGYVAHQATPAEVLLISCSCLLAFSLSPCFLSPSIVFRGSTTCGCRTHLLFACSLLGKNYGTYLHKCRNIDSPLFQVSIFILSAILKSDCLSQHWTFNKPTFQYKHCPCSACPGKMAIMTKVSGCIEVYG